MIYTCHCANCQRFTSSAFSVGMIVDAQVFHLTGVEPRVMLYTADSGRHLTRWVCPECGSWICSGAKPGVVEPQHIPRRARRNLGRHLLATSSSAFLDSEQAALGRAAR